MKKIVSMCSGIVSFKGIVRLSLIGAFALFLGSEVQAQDYVESSVAVEMITKEVEFVKAEANSTPVTKAAPSAAVLNALAKKSFYEQVLFAIKDGSEVGEALASGEKELIERGEDPTLAASLKEGLDDILRQ